MAPERNARANLKMAIRPHRPRLHPPRQAFRPLHIIAPNARSERHLAIIRPRQNLFFILPFQDGQDGPERFFGNDFAVIGRIVEKRGREIESLISCVIVCGVEGRDVAACNGLPALGGDLRVHGSDFVVLHAVLHGADEVFWVGARADFHVSFDVGGEGVEEFLVDGFVDVEAFDHHADLGGAEEGGYCELCVRLEY